MKKLPDCRKSPAKTSGKRRWVCSIASAAEAGPAPTARAHRHRLGDRGQHARWRASARTARSPSTTGRDRRAPAARRDGAAAPRGDLRGARSRSAARAGRARGRRGRPAAAARSSSRASSGRQRVTSSSAPSALDATVRLSVAARDSLGGQPRRLLVARQRHHRLLAERAGRAQRVRRIGPVLVRAVGALHRERVLEAGERRRRHPQRPAVALRGRRASAATGKPRSVASRTPASSRRGRARWKAIESLLHERPRGGDRRRHRRQASGPRATREVAGVRCRDALHSHRAARRRPDRRARVRRPAPADRSDLRPARRAGRRPDQAHRARREPPTTSAPIDAVLLSHDHHSDNLDVSGRAFLAARRAHADHDGGRRAPGRQRRRPRALGRDRARAPGRRAPSRSPPSPRCTAPRAASP